MTADDRARRVPLTGMLAAQGVSLVGTRISMVALPWFVLSTTGSAAQTGLVAAAELVPLVATKALAGPLLDRLGPRRVTLWCDVLSFFVVALIPLLNRCGFLEIRGLLLLVAVAGALRGPGDGGKSAMVPEVARTARASVERVSGLLSAVERTSSMGGAALAGVLIAWIGAANVLYVNAASFLISWAVFGIATSGLGRPANVEPSAGGAGYSSELREGWVFLRRDAVLVALCSMIALTNLVDQGHSAVLAPVWARESGAGAAALGALLAVTSGASVAGALAAARWGERLPRFPVYASAFLIGGAPRYVTLSLGVSAAPTFAVFAVCGFALGFVNPVLSAVIYERIPDRLLGRVTSLIGAICWSLMPLGVVLAGLAVDQLGLRSTLLLGGALYLAASAAPLLVPAFRHMTRPDERAAIVTSSNRPITLDDPEEHHARDR